MGHPYLAGPYPRAYAHRGWHTGDLAGLENTLVGIARAVAEGFSYVEFDVHVSADGVPVVHHDATLDRTTDAKGRVGDRTAAELDRVRVRGQEPVPRLEEVLAALPETRFTVELKTGRAAAPVLELLERYDAFDRVCLAGFADAWMEPGRVRYGDRLFTSMGKASVVAMRAQAWRESLPGVLGRVSRAVPPVPVVGDLGQIPFALGPVPVTGPALVRSVHATGREIHVWTVNRPADMERMLAMGVDGIISDRPDLLREVMRGRGVWAQDGRGTGGRTVADA